jgi:hypothetical protein
MKSDNNKRLITLNVITLSGFFKGEKEVEVTKSINYSSLKAKLLNKGKHFNDSRENPMIKYEFLFNLSEKSRMN